MSREFSWAVMEENGNQVSVAGEENASVGKVEFKALLSGLQPVLMQESFKRELPAPMPNFALHPPLKFSECREMCLGLRNFKMTTWSE